MTPLDLAFRARPLAHRALHDIARGRPENSRAAVAAAIDAGYGIEIDIQPSADNIAMVFHDAGLARLTHTTGPITARTARDLGQIPLKHGTEGIATLSEILTLVAGRVPLLIEVKDQDGSLGPKIGALEEAVTRALHGYTGATALMSFNPHSVGAMADLAPHVPRGLTTCAFTDIDWPKLSAVTRARLATIPDYISTRSSFVSHDHRDLDNPRLADLAQQGADILCWTIRTPGQAAVARRIAQNITFEGLAA